VEGELMGHIPLLVDGSRELAQARAALDDTNAKVDVLFAQKVRSNQYQSQAQRDAALQEELKSIEGYEASQEQRRGEVQEEVKQVEGRVKEIEESLTVKEKHLEERKAFIEERGQKWEELKRQEDKSLEKKK